MYSGTTLTPASGRLLGAHQKIDKLAYRSLCSVALECKQFPSIRSILHFEGVNGPDAIKRKSPAKDEPWHYYAPFDDADTQILNIIKSHTELLTSSLRNDDTVRAAFEAAWLAHAIVDGLTPAHHYPYEEELTNLRGGEGIDSRTSFRQKVVMPGDNRRQKVQNNWKMWGPKGLLTTHGLFEWGIAAIIAPISARNRRIPFKQHDIDELLEHGIVEIFKMKAREVAALDMYAEYYQTGWTPRLARKVRKYLVPIIVQTVGLAWYGALHASEEKRQ